MFGRDDALLDKRYSNASPQPAHNHDTSFGSVGSVTIAAARMDFPSESTQLPSFATPVAAPVVAAPPSPLPVAPAAPVEAPVFQTITKTQVADSPAIPESMNFSALFGSSAKSAAAPSPVPAAAQTHSQPQSAQSANTAELPSRQLEALGAALEDFRAIAPQSLPADAQLSFVALESLTRQALNGEDDALKQLRLFGYEHLLAIARTLPSGTTNSQLNQAAARLIGCGLVVPACTAWQGSISHL